MPKVNILPEEIRVYSFLGLDFSYEEGNAQVYCECPFCGREAKFSIEVKTGKWRCFVCNEGTETDEVISGGNSTVFIRTLWEKSRKQTKAQDYQELADRRGLLKGETFEARGLCKSIITKEWLIPGYGVDGSLNNLYRYVSGIPMPCPKLGHQLHGMNCYDSKKSTIAICEGPWDGDALHEALGMTKETSEGYSATANKALSMLADINVISVPGMNVFFDSWFPLFAGKRVVFLYDNDHPKQQCSGCKKLRSIHKEVCDCGVSDISEGKISPPAGDAGEKKAMSVLAKATNPPDEMHYVHWGDEGYDKDLPCGYDVRDMLKEAPTVARRAAVVEQLWAKIRKAPDDLLQEAKRTAQSDDEKSVLHTVECTSWADLVLAWRKAMRWRQSMEDVLAVMIAVAVSTDQVGDQLFIQVIGDAGSGKTRFCDAMMTCPTCYALEHLTGFHSGWKDEEGNNYSLLDRINHMTLITPEGDTLMSNPKLGELMSQQRRIFDGKSTASYKNMKEDMSWSGLRTPWIMAGTPALLDLNQSRLGDRFLKVFVDSPDEGERREILRRVGYTALQAVMQKSEEDATTQMTPELVTAYQMTGGYISYLKKNVVELLNMLEIDEEAVVDTCADYGEFTAYLRARPGEEKDSHETKELPTRLTHQYVRMGCCLSVVMNRPKFDDKVLRLVRKVALDTASGITLNIVKTIFEHEEQSMQVPGIAFAIQKGEEQTRKLLRFLRKIKAVDLYQIINPDGTKSSPKWRLEKTMFHLYEKIFGKRVEEEIPF